MVFIHVELVDALVYRGVVKTRKDAVHLGRLLVKEYNLFSHVSGDHSFCDSFLFYRMNEAFAGDAHAGVPGTDISSKRSVPVGELGSYADAFRRVVDVRDRTYLMKTHRSCFVGSEAVDALVFAGIAATREDAVKLHANYKRSCDCSKMRSQTNHSKTMTRYFASERIILIAL